MKVLKFKGKMPLRTKLLILLGILIIIAGISMVYVYMTNEEIKEWVYINIFKREITEEDVATIAIDSDKNQYIYAYDRYIAILCNGKLDIYNNYGTKVHEIEIGISNPIFSKNGSYLAISEKERTKNLCNSRWENAMGK